jgi:hypothetical protein
VTRALARVFMIPALYQGLNRAAASTEVSLYWPVERRTGTAWNGAKRMREAIHNCPSLNVESVTDATCTPLMTASRTEPRQLNAAAGPGWRLCASLRQRWAVK